MFAKGYSPDEDWEAGYNYNFKEILKKVNSWGKKISEVLLP